MDEAMAWDYFYEIYDEMPRQGPGERESCWLRSDPPAELVALFSDDCPDMGDVEARRRAIAANGYELLHEFVLPERGWEEEYYAPLSGLLERFRARHAGDPAALEVAARSEHEIAAFRRHPGAVGYVFFVMRLAGT